jgi:hypothetical protein
MTAPVDRDDPDRVRDVVRALAVPAASVSTAVVAGTAGYFVYLPTLPAYSDAASVPLLLEAFFRSLGFLVLNMGAVSSPEPTALALFTIARGAGLFFFSYAAVAGVGVVFADQLRPLRIEAWSLFGRLPWGDDAGHVVVCGIGDDGDALATDALDDGRNVVAIDRQRTDRTAELEAAGAIVLTGDATREGMLVGRARLRRAADVYVTTGSDTTNSAIVETIDRWAASTDLSQPIDVTARIADRRLRRTLHEETTPVEGVHLHSYDVPSATARELLSARPIDDLVEADQRVNVWLVGWTPLSEALLDQLLNLMHYPDGVDRQVTVVTAAPAEARRDIAASFPTIDPEWWADASMQEFVAGLFPDVDVRPLPGSDSALLSDQCSLYDAVRPRDRLTIVADDTDVWSLRALLSTWGPKLDELTRQLDLDTHLAYRGSTEAEWTLPLSAVETSAYAAFGDGCSINAVRGTERDRTARRVALVYHLLYEDDPLAAFPWVDSTEQPPDGIDAVLERIESLPPAERERQADAVWRDLPEYQRESNRYAADHAAVKLRMADLLGGESIDDDTVRTIAEAEHRRWCAEKILDGWEPLPESAADRWQRDQRALRAQRYHPNILPTATLRDRMDGAWDKDVSQVRAILTHPELFGSDPTSGE